MRTNLKICWLISMFLISVNSIFAQTVIGTVSDESTLLPGVNIVVKGTQNGTSTDFDGKYTLENVASDAVLQFSFIGYKTIDIPVNGQTTIIVNLNPDLEALEEVIITGYGQSTSKRTLTTAISTVGSEQIESIPVSRPEAVLQGTAPGVVVQQTSGDPGAPLTVRIRGVGSPNSSQPLYIVDGLPVPSLQHLNTDDIRSISVLKDAASAAIYGSRGGNGVVLVETKKGYKNMDKLQVNIHAYAGIQTLGYKPNLMNASQYMDYYNQAVLEADGNLNGQRGAFTEAEAQQLANTDWYDEIFETAPVSNISASITDGGEKIDYSVSGGMFDQEGIVAPDKSNFNRKNIRATLNADLRKNIQIHVSGDFAEVERNFLTTNSGGTGTALMNYITAIPSIYPTRAENGELFNMGRQSPAPEYNGVPLNVLGAVTNPLWSIEIQNNETTQDILVLNGGISWQPIDNLDIRANFSRYSNNAMTRSFTPDLEYPEQTFSTAGFVNYAESPTSFDRVNYGGIVEYDFADVLNGDDHQLKLLGGVEVLKDELRNGGRVQDYGEFLTNDFSKVNFALSTDISDAIVTPEIVQQVNMVSYFTKVDYNFKRKYLISATLRNDSSSNFGSNNRSGWFPSASIGWVLSEEDFMSNSGSIDLLKIRASYGLSGTDASPRALAFLSTVNTRTGYAGNTGIALTGLANPDLKWEELSQINIGFDLNAFNNEFGFSFDYYIKETSDILLAGNTPLTSGINPSVVNVGNVKNSGFEVAISYNKTYENFSWNTNLGIGYNVNEVTSLGNGGQALQGGFTGQLYSDPVTLTEVGQPISSFYGYKVEGLDANGNLVFADLDNSGNDKTTPNVGDKTFIGKPLPDYTVGWNINFNFYGFDLGAFFYAAQGNDIFDATIRYDALSSNRPASYLEDGAPRNIAISGGYNGESLVSDFHVQDGSFVRLKNLTLGYSLSDDTLNNSVVSRVRFYVSGVNLFTATSYTGADPEIGAQSAGNILDMGIDRGFYPQSMGGLLGFQINF